MLEVCLDNLESAVNAIGNGADELELCSGLSDGGLTPSPGLARKVIAEVCYWLSLMHDYLWWYMTYLCAGVEEGPGSEIA